MSDAPKPVRLPPRPAFKATNSGSGAPARKGPVIRYRTPQAEPARQPAAPAKSPSPQAPERSVLDLIVEIKAGRVNPKLLSPQDRQLCGAQLSAEGLSVPEIAQFLKCSDRTIARDRRALQEAAALEHDPKFCGRMAGQLVSEATLVIDRIRRVSRDRTTPSAVKVDAEHRCWQVLSDLSQRLQSLGFLPIAVQRHQAEVAHFAAEVPSYGQILADVRRVRMIAVAALPPGAPELAQIASVEEDATRAELAGRAAEVVSAVRPALQPASEAL